MKIYAVSLSAFCVLFLSLELHAQKNRDRKLMYKCWITPTKESVKLKQLFYEVGDSSILMSSSYIPEDYITNNFSTLELEFLNIEKIQLRSRARIAGYTLLGALVGFAEGAIIGSGQGDDPPCPNPFNENLN